MTKRLLSQLYDLPALNAFLDSSAQNGFKDSQSGVILARQLTAVDPTIFEKKYPELALMNSGVQVDNSGGYALFVQSLRLLEKGGYTQNNDQDDNKGKISLTGESSQIKVYPNQAHSTWTDDEIKNAELNGINLPSQYLAAHNKIYMRTLDEIGLIGVAGTTNGLLSSTAFPVDTAAGLAASLTPIALYNEFAELIVAQWNAVNNTPEYMANRVVMPVRVMNVLQSKLLDTPDSVKNILQALKQNFPTVTFLATFRADTVANGGNQASTSVTVAYSNSGDVMKLRVPVPLTIGEIIKPSSFEFRVDSKFRAAGLDVLEGTGGFKLTGL